MEATVAERGQITLPKEVRDALGLVKGPSSPLKSSTAKMSAQERSGSAGTCSRRFKLPDGMTTDDVMRELRGVRRAILSMKRPPDDRSRFLRVNRRSHQRRRIR